MYRRVRTGGKRNGQKINRRASKHTQAQFTFVLERPIIFIAATFHLCSIRNKFNRRSTKLNVAVKSKISPESAAGVDLRPPQTEKFV